MEVVPVIHRITVAKLFPGLCAGSSKLKPMPACLYIAVEGEDPGFDIFANGHALARNEDALERLATSLNVSPLFSFLCADEEAVAALVENGSDERGGQSFRPQPKWFDPLDGLLTVQILLSHLNYSPSSLGSETAAVFLELREYERVLRKTVERGLHWHLELSLA
jgi:hypothetical protein